MKILIMSDIHANLTALNCVLDSVKNIKIDKCVILGDLIDYGMRPNEVIEAIKNMPYDIICNIWGNHEKAIIDKETESFSAERGKVFSAYTASILNKESIEYICNKMNSSGFQESIIDGKKILFIHGSLENIFWKSISVGNTNPEYKDYDFVFSAHSHKPYMFEEYFKADEPIMRNEKKTVFINVGSVGQPRNHVSHGQYGIFDTLTGAIQFERVCYNYKQEQELYNSLVDEFYKNRLETGV